MERARTLWLRVTGGLAFLLVLAWTGCAVAPDDTSPVNLPAGFVSVSATLREFGLKPEAPLSTAGEQTFANAFRRLELTGDSRIVSLDGRRVFLGEGVLTLQNQLWISRTDLESTLRPLLRPQDYGGVARPVRLIWIDAGHGGRDPGAQNAALDVREKDVALDVALRLGKILESQGFEVRHTRTEDVFVDIVERAELSRVADMMVSIHFNAAGNLDARGTEVYALTPAGQASTGDVSGAGTDFPVERGNATDPWNALLGFAVHDAMLEKLGTVDRGLKRARFAVLRLTDVPAVLVEPGFLSHDDEAAEIADENRRGEIAESIANGIVAYADIMLALASKS